MNNKSSFGYIIYLLIPILLITGPALPDIALTLFVFLVIIFKINLLFRINQTWMIFFLILWVWFLLISFFAYDFEISISDSIIFIRFILFIILANLLFTSLDATLIKIILYTLFVSCIFVSIDTLFQFYNYDYENGFGSDLLGKLPEDLYGRLSGPFNNLVPGSYLSRLIFFIIILYLLEKEKIEKNIYLLLLFYLILILIFSVIYFTGERMAVATTLLGLFIIIFSKNIRKLIILPILFSLFFILINITLHPHYNNYKILSSGPNHQGLLIEREINCEKINQKCKKNYLMQPKFLSVLENFNKSAYGEIYSSALHMWNDNKVTGIGLNNFTLVCEEQIKYRKFNQNFGCTTHPHNIYIQVLVESGIVGLVIFLVFVILLFLKIYKIKNLDFKLIFISIHLSIFWPIMSTGSILKNWNMVFISFILSLLLILIDNSNFSKKYLLK